jgi:hypothetical protein
VHRYDFGCVEACFYRICSLGFLISLFKHAAGVPTRLRIVISFTKSWERVLLLFLFLQVFARGQQQLRSRRESTGSDQATQPDSARRSDAADASAMESSSRTSSPLPSSELSAAGCAVLWEDFPRHLRRSPTPSSSSESSGTTADTFLLEDVSSSVFLHFLVLE